LPPCKSSGRHYLTLPAFLYQPQIPPLKRVIVVFQPFFLELGLITDRMNKVTSILFDTGTEENAPPSVRVRGIVGTTTVMVCVLQAPVEFEKQALL
jgi:hypothetical protein